MAGVDLDSVLSDLDLASPDFVLVISNLDVHNAGVWFHDFEIWVNIDFWFILEIKL